MVDMSDWQTYEDSQFMRCVYYRDEFQNGQIHGQGIAKGCHGVLHHCIEGEFREGRHVEDKCFHGWLERSGTECLDDRAAMTRKLIEYSTVSMRSMIQEQKAAMEKERSENG